MVKSLSRSRDGTRHLQVIGIRNLVRRNNHGSESAAAVVNLRLCEVEGVFALDIPGGDVVGERKAEDAVAGANHDRKFRLRRREMGIGTDADIVTAAHAMPGRALEKYFGARLTIDVRVHAFPCAVLGIAEGSAGFVSAAAAPHFGRMNGKDGLR